MREQERKTETPISLTASVRTDNPDMCSTDCSYLLPSYHLRHTIEKRSCSLFGGCNCGDTSPGSIRFYYALVVDEKGIHRNISCKSAETRHRDRIEAAIYSAKKADKQEVETKQGEASEYEKVAGWSKML